MQKFHLLSIFFRNILHGYSKEQTLTTCMYTYYLTLWCGPPLFLGLQSNLAITQRYSLWNQAVSELWYKREGYNTTKQIFTYSIFATWWTHRHTLGRDTTWVVKELQNKREGCHKTKQIFTISCSTAQYSHHPSLAKERAQSQASVS